MDGSFHGKSQQNEWFGGKPYDYGNLQIGMWPSKNQISPGIWSSKIRNQTVNAVIHQSSVWESLPNIGALPAKSHKPGILMASCRMLQVLSTCPCNEPSSGWWFGTFFFPPYIGLLIIPIDEYFSEGWPNHQPALTMTHKFDQMIGSWPSWPTVAVIFPADRTHQDGKSDLRDGTEKMRFRNKIIYV